MAITKVTSSSLRIVVGQMLGEYSDDVSKACYVVVDEVSQNAVDKLRTAGRFGGRKFRKAWKRTIRQYGSGRVECDVHLKKPYYRIGHLLEHGHVVRRGGRVIGNARAFNFIKPVEEEAVEEYERKMKEMIGKVV